MDFRRSVAQTRWPTNERLLGDAVLRCVTGHPAKSRQGYLCNGGAHSAYEDIRSCVQQKEKRFVLASTS